VHDKTNSELLIKNLDLDEVKKMALLSNKHLEPIELKAETILQSLKDNPQLQKYVDPLLHIPKPYPGYSTSAEKIKLIILGQDPTVKEPKSREKIRTVLNLDLRGSLKSYLRDKICYGLGINLETQVYATNFLKNFFIKPPTQLDEGVFPSFSQIWLQLLLEELLPFRDLPVITLGQPLLEIVAKGNVSKKVRDYWGYNSEWKSGKTGPFKYLKPEENCLQRVIFPFPHQPSISKVFYQKRMNDYISFVRDIAFNS
jgi:hypothetical protein